MKTSGDREALALALLTIGMSEGKKRLFRFAQAQRRGMPADPADVDAIADAFRLILKGEDPKKALQLDGKRHQGRAKLSTSAIRKDLPLSVEVERLRAAGLTLERAVGEVSRRTGFSETKLEHVYKRDHVAASRSVPQRPSMPDAGTVSVLYAAFGCSCRSAWSFASNRQLVSASSISCRPQETASSASAPAPMTERINSRSSRAWEAVATAGAAWRTGSAVSALKMRSASRSESCLRHALFRLRRKGGAASRKTAGKPLVYLAIPDRVPCDRRGKWSRAPASRINAGRAIAPADGSTYV
jgi:hypothetical protein